MDINKIRWSYAIARPSCPLEMELSVGPISPERVRELLGGDYELIPLRDGTCLAALRDRFGLPSNNHYQHGINGPVLVGKMDGDQFVGALGVAL